MICFSESASSSKSIERAEALYSVEDEETVRGISFTRTKKPTRYIEHELICMPMPQRSRRTQQYTRVEMRIRLFSQLDYNRKTSATAQNHQQA